MAHFNFDARIHISGTAEARVVQLLYAGRIYQVLALGWQIIP